MVLMKRCYLQFTTDNKIFIKDILVFKAEILIDRLRRRVVQFRIVTSASYDTQTEKNK